MSTYHVRPNPRLDFPKIVYKTDTLLDPTEKHVIAPLPNKPFVWAVVGPSNSGKTTMMIRLLTGIKRSGLLQTRCYRKIFNTIFLVSPSLHNIKSNPFEEIMEKEGQYYDELNDDVMADIFDYCKNPPMIDEEGNEFELPPKILIVLDDCISELKGSRFIQDTLSTICANKRHLAGGVSIFFLSQVFNSIPAKVRKNFTHISLFRTSSKKEMNTIYDELDLGMEKSEYYKLLRFTFNTPHSFLFTSFEDPDKILYKRFEKIEKVSSVKTPTKIKTLLDHATETPTEEEADKKEKATKEAEKTDLYT
jgi:hypothetical protein